MTKIRLDNKFLFVKYLIFFLFNVYDSNANIFFFKKIII